MMLNLANVFVLDRFNDKQQKTCIFINTDKVLYSTLRYPIFTHDEFAYILFRFDTHELKVHAGDTEKTEALYADICASCASCASIDQCRYVKVD
jgi:hypothetical protein